MVAHESDHRVVRRGALLLVAVERDLHRGVDEDGAEDRDHPAEAVDERHSGENQRTPQDQRAQHPPEQHTVLVLGRDGEAAEEQHEDEQVVDGE